MKAKILLSIIILLLINELSINYSKKRERFYQDNNYDKLLTDLILNIPSGLDKYNIQQNHILKKFNDFTEKVKKINHEKNVRRKTILIQRNMIDNNDKDIYNGSRQNQTSKRNDQIEVREISEIEYKKNLAIKTLIFIICLSVVLLIYKRDLITRVQAIVLYVLGLIIWAIYLVFMLKIKQSNVDDNYYKKYNFIKPSEEEVLQSKLNYQKKLRKMDERNVEEVYKNNSIPANSIDINEYINENSDERSKRCSINNVI
jgi:hypothetical protein